jgi:hypothetical protein
VLASALGCSTSSSTPDAAASVDAMPIADPLEFCRVSADAICTRAFQCVPTAMRDATFTGMYYASVADCMTMFEAGCTDPTDCPTYDPNKGGLCVAQLNSSSCADLLLDNAIFPPDSCISACGQ